MHQLLHGWVSEVGGLNDSLQGWDFSVGAFMKEECWMITVMSLGCMQHFPCIFMHLLNLFLVMPWSSNTPATLVMSQACSYLACIFLETCYKVNFEHELHPLSYTTRTVTYPSTQGRMRSSFLLSLHLLWLHLHCQSSQWCLMLLSGCDRSSMLWCRQSHLSVDKRSAFKNMQKGGHSALYLGRHYLDYYGGSIHWHGGSSCA